jgi:hypothetical protein
LEQQGPKYTFGFLQCKISTEELIVSREKMRAKNKKISAKKHKFTSSSTRGLVFRRGRKSIKNEQNQQMIREEVYGSNLSILLSLYPKILAIASGVTPIGSAVAHPIERSRQKGRKEVETGDKEKVDESKVYV